MARARQVRTEVAGTTATGLPRVPEALVDRVLRVLTAVVHALGRAVGSHCEFVLHDLRDPSRSIVAIGNGAVGGRRVGGPLIGGPLQDAGLRLLGSRDSDSQVTIGHTAHTRDGRELRSTTLVLRVPSGRPVIAFRINQDLSMIAMAQQLLADLVGTRAGDHQAARANTAQRDIAGVIRGFIRGALDEVRRLPAPMDRDERLRAVRAMDERGLVLITGGLEQAAGALDVSRFTLYTDLKEIRDPQPGGRGQGGEPTLRARGRAP